MKNQQIMCMFAHVEEPSMESYQEKEGKAANITIKGGTIITVTGGKRAFSREPDLTALGNTHYSITEDYKNANNVEIKVKEGHQLCDNWSYDENGHWKQCKIAECKYTSPQISHVSDSGTTTCNSCGYNGTNKHFHTIGIDAEWGKDSNSHWHKCSCGEKMDYVSHIYGEVAEDSYIKTEATHTAKATYYKSCICGEKSAETFEDGEPIGHSYSTEWKKDDTNHWNECSCGDKKDIAEHVYSSNFDRECNECGYVRSISGGGTYTPVKDPITNDNGNTETGTAPSTTLEIKSTTSTSNGVKTTFGAVDTATGDKLIKQAVANKSEAVIIDMTTSKPEAALAKGAKTEVALTENTVKELAEKTSAGLDIKTDNGVVSLDSEALKALADYAGDSGDVKITIETVKAENKEVRFEISITTSKGTVTDFGEGVIKVTVPLSSELKNRKVACVYIDKTGSYTKMKGSSNNDGTYTFETGHLSTYAIMEEAEADKVIAEQNKEKVNTLIKEFKFKASTKYTSKKNVKVTAKVLKGDVDAITDMGYRVEYTFSRAEKKGGRYYKKKTSEDKTYINTAGKKGRKYYYKVQLLVYEGDVVVGKSELKQSEYGVRTWKK